MTDTKSQPNTPLATWHRTALRTAVVAAVLALLTAGMLLAHAVRLRAANPFNAPALVALKAQAAKGQAETTAAYRDLDAQYNARFTAARAAMARGTRLLLGFAVLFLLAANAAWLLRRHAPDLGAVAPADLRAAGLAGRYAVGALAVILGGAVLGLASIPPPLLPGATPTVATAPPPVKAPVIPEPVIETPLPLPAGGVGEGIITPPTVPPPGSTTTKPWQVATTILPSPRGEGPGERAPVDPLTRLTADEKANWAGFRGPAGVGIAASEVPLGWDVKAGKGMFWKAAVPLAGNSSPVVWGNNVFLTGGTAEESRVYCFAADTGALRWTGGMFGIDGTPDTIESGSDTGFAPSTPVTDGVRVCAIFPSGSVAAFDMDGNRLWARNLGPVESMYGYAASPLLYKNLLIIQWDMGGSADDGKSRLIALDAATGKTVWTTKRPVPNSWASPAVIAGPHGDELIACANPWVIAYDPATGKERWRAECLGGDVASSPAWGGGVLIACAPYQKIVALRPGGSGNVTKTALAWSVDENAPDTTSPAANGEICVVTSGSQAFCFDVKTGKKLWETDLGDTIVASPLLAGDRLLFVEMGGTVHVLAAARTLQALATLPVGEPVQATPALVGGKLFIRAGANLYCIGGGS
jgi:outer membrane protein assembly factor BamB